MKVEATDDKGEKQIWVIEGAAPQQLTEGGLTAIDASARRSRHRDGTARTHRRRSSAAASGRSSDRRTASNSRGRRLISDHGNASSCSDRRRAVAAAVGSFRRAASSRCAGWSRRTGRASAPYDYTGYWVSEVTEKWRFRMLVPDKGDYTQVPLNPEGRKVAAAWDPAKDEASGEACRSYGGGGILQVPGRLHITWQDDNTLRMDTDSGTQTRLFHFAESPPANDAPSWQGYSVASWGGDEPRDRRDGQGGPVQDREGQPCGRQSATEASGLSQGGDHAPASRISAEERRAVQRQRARRGVLRHVFGSVHAKIPGSS